MSGLWQLYGGCPIKSLNRLNRVLLNRAIKSRKARIIHEFRNTTKTSVYFFRKTVPLNFISLYYTKIKKNPLMIQGTVGGDLLLACVSREDEIKEVL
jgi:hypothetical protein